MAARLLLGRLPVISSVRVVINDSSMPVSGMAGTAGLTEGCRWNNAAAGYAGHPDGPGRSHVCRQGALVRNGHLRLPTGLPVGGLNPHDGEYQIPIGRAAEILGEGERHTRRLLSAYRGAGAAALAHGNRGRQPHNAVGLVDKNAGSGPDYGADQQPAKLILGLLLRRGFRGATRKPRHCAA